ncbi:MAG: PilZ domain-containing protein [Proteobacteria bacterium]|nr:PilZ domain-containing protein [Pseudomonadota bacterium]
MPEIQDVTENRKHERQQISIEVVVVMKGRLPMTYKTGDLSEGGVFLLSDGRDGPKVGEEFAVSLPEFIGTDQPVAMRAVVRHSSDRGIGVEFLGVLE